MPEKDLITWTAPGRPFKRRDREYYITLLAISAVVGLILFLAEGPVPVILLAALIFLYYILNTVEPPIIEYKITNFGIKIAGAGTGWQIMRRYWFTQKAGSDLLVFETANLPGRLELVINGGDKEKIKTALKDYVTEEEASPSFLDKTSGWISSKITG